MGGRGDHLSLFFAFFSFSSLFSHTQPPGGPAALRAVAGRQAAGGAHRGPFSLFGGPVFPRERGNLHFFFSSSCSHHLALNVAFIGSTWHHRKRGASFLSGGWRGEPRRARPQKGRNVGKWPRKVSYKLLGLLPCCASVVLLLNGAAKGLRTARVPAPRPAGTHEGKVRVLAKTLKTKPTWK